MKYLALFICLIAFSASAEIYQWTDSYGTVNFTDDRAKIPSRYTPEVFRFNGEHKWTIDTSNTKADNQMRLDLLRIRNAPKPSVIPAPTVIIKIEDERRRKRHRNHRND